MSRRPPHFENFVFLGELSEPEDQLRTKILSGKLAAYIYSTLGRGDLEPIPISAGEFSVAEDDGWESFSDPEPQPAPFQIMVIDRDTRRLPGTRRHIKVPHWIYFLKADLAPRKGKGGRPPSLDKASVAAEVLGLMDEHGAFFAGDPTWNALARLYDALRQKFGIELADSTLEPYVKEPLEQWRKSKQQPPKT